MSANDTPTMSADEVLAADVDAVACAIGQRRDVMASAAWKRVRTALAALIVKCDVLAAKVKELQQDIEGAKYEYSERLERSEWTI